MSAARNVSWSKEVDDQYNMHDNTASGNNYYDSHHDNYDNFDEYDNNNIRSTPKEDPISNSDDYYDRFFDSVVDNESNKSSNSNKKRYDDNRIRCPNCNSTAIEQHEASGASICTECGVVVEENMIVSSVDFVEGAGGSSSMVGQFVSATSSKAYTGGGGGAGGRNSNPNRYGYSRDSREQTLLNARRRIQDVASRLRLGVQTIDSAHRLYTIALERNFVMGRKSSYVTAACLYIACRQQKLQHMLIDFSDALAVNVYALGATFLKFRRLLGLKLELIDPALYIYRFAAHLNLDDAATAVSMTALRLVARMKRDWISTGRRPAGICAAALLIASRVHGFDDKTTHDVTKILRVCGMTVNNRIREFQQTPSARLTIEQFHTNDPENDLDNYEHDPPIFIRNRIMEARAKAIREGNIELLESGLLDDPLLQQNTTAQSKWRNIKKLIQTNNTHISFYKQLEEFILSDKTTIPSIIPTKQLAISNKPYKDDADDDDTNDNDKLTEEQQLMKVQPDHSTPMTDDVINDTVNGQKGTKSESKTKEQTTKGDDSNEQRKAEKQETRTETDDYNDQNIVSKQVTTDEPDENNTPPKTPLQESIIDQMKEGESSKEHKYHLRNRRKEDTGSGKKKGKKKIESKNGKTEDNNTTNNQLVVYEGEGRNYPTTSITAVVTTPLAKAWKNAYPTSSNRNKALILPQDATLEEQLPSIVPTEGKLSLNEWKLTMPDNSIDLEIESLFRTEEEEKQKEAIFNKLNVEYIEQQKQKIGLYSGADGGGENNNTENKSKRGKYNKRKEPEGTTTEEQLMAAVSNRKVSRKINYDALSSIFDDDGSFSTDVVVTKAYNTTGTGNSSMTTPRDRTKKASSSSSSNRITANNVFDNEGIGNDDEGMALNFDDAENDDAGMVFSL